MKIKSVTPRMALIVETDSIDYPRHTRYGPDSWTVSMGESDERVNDCTKLEAAFQVFVKAVTSRVIALGDVGNTEMVEVRHSSKS